MADTIEKVQVEVEASARGVSAVFQKLESQINTIKRAMESVDATKLNAVTKHISTSGMAKAEKDISSSVDKIKQALSGLESYKKTALGGDSSSLTSFQRRVTSIQSSIDVLGEKLKQMGDNRVGKNIDTDALQEYRRQLVEIQNALNGSQKEVSNYVARMKKEKPEIDTSKITLNLQSIKDKATSTLSALKKVASGIGSAFALAGKGIKGIGARMLGLSGGLDKATNGFKHNLKTLIKYGFGVRSLYVLFRRLRKAVIESFTELQKSGAMFQTTKANVEGLKTALSTLKFQFGAAFEPLFNTVAPAITSFINYLISLMNTLSAFIAKLTGRSTYSKVAQVMNKTGGAAGSAGKAVKELNKQLQNFDELNNISPENNSGGGGGGGGGGADTSAIYTEESVDSALGDFAKSLADAIEKGDWYQVGNIISTKLTEALNSIDWDKVFAVAGNFGRNLADFLNGLITPDLFSALGTTIGNAIKTKLTFLNELGKELDWPNIGHSVAAGLKAFVETHPLVLMADTFSNWAVGITDGLATAIRDALDNGTLDTISNDITKAIKKINIREVAWNVGSIVSGLANSIYKIVSNKETWHELGLKIGEGINGFFGSMSATDPATGLNGFEALAKDTSAITSGILNMFITAIKNVKWNEVGKAISDFFKNIDWGQLAKDVTNLTTGILDALTEAVNSIEWDEVGKAVADFLANLNWGKIIVSLGNLALAIASAIASALIGLVTNGDVTTNIGTAILTLIGAAKLLNLGSKLTTLISGALGSEFKSSISTKLILGFAGLALLINSDEIGTAIGKKIAQAFGDDELVSYYEEYNTWPKIRKRIQEDSNLVILDLTNFTLNVAKIWESLGKIFASVDTPIKEAIDRVKDYAEKMAKTIFNAGKDTADAFERGLYGGNSGLYLSPDANYEFDANGGVRYAYAKSGSTSNVDNKRVLYTVQYQLEGLYNKGYISQKKLNEYLEGLNKLYKLSNKKNVNFQSLIEMMGDINSMDDLKKFVDYMNNLDGEFFDHDADYTIDVNGDANNKSDLDKLGGSMNYLNGQWKNNTANMTLNTETDGSKGGGVAKITNLGDTFKQKLYDIWQGKEAKFTTSYDTTKNSKALEDLDALGREWSKKSASADFSVSTEDMSNWQNWDSYKKLCDLYKHWYGTDAEFGVKFTVNDMPNIKQALLNVLAELNSRVSSFGGTPIPESSINKAFMAKGGVADRALFGVFGEAGAEALVPLENNLGWLGKMSDMLVSGMEQSASLGSFVSPPTTDFASQSYNYAANATNEYLMTQMIQEMQTQNELLEQILDKPSGITSGEVFRAVRSEGYDFSRRTGNSPFNY